MEIIRDLGTRLEGKTYRRWCLAKCDFCGNIVERRMQYSIKAKSCGCATHLKSPFKHGMSRTRQYSIWADMKDRCSNQRNSHYYLYGGRGISYDKSWESFENFWKDMEEGYSDNLTIDRIDSNGNYVKENCQWITRQENTAKAQKTGTFKKRNISTYYRLITQDQLIPYANKLSKAKHGEILKIQKECAEALGISVNTAIIYLRKKELK